MPYFALLDDAVSGRAVLFQNLQYSDRILSDGLDRLDGLLAQAAVEADGIAVGT